MTTVFIIVGILVVTVIGLAIATVSIDVYLPKPKDED